MKTVTSPRVSYQSAPGGIFIGELKVIITMFVMPPFNNHILTLYSHRGHYSPLTFTNISVHGQSWPDACQHPKQLRLTKPSGTYGLRHDLLTPRGPPPG
jgi:hypothetical protein